MFNTVTPDATREGSPRMMIIIFLVYVESSEKHQPEQMEVSATPVRDTEPKGMSVVFSSLLTSH